MSSAGYLGLVIGEPSRSDDQSQDLGGRAREAILELLAARGPEKTICPSEAARALAGDGDFRPYMEPVRDAAARLADEDRLVVTQKRRPVRIGEVRGPIRLGLPRDAG